jgi:rare lipoprotein A
MPKPLFAALALACLTSCAHTPAFACLASYYGTESGTHTASGERFVADGLSAALPSFRAGMKPWRVRVTNLGNGRSIVVRVNDRGPASWTGKCIDLSLGAARVLGMLSLGIATVSIEPIAPQ